MRGPPQITLSDAAARCAAIRIHDRSFLVEAGAGSGKTAVLAGRIAMLLTEGVEPKFIAAVTFTEFAASELLIRVREFVSKLVAGQIPAELRAALPDGLSEDRRNHLFAASQAIDEITCSTIHGFCQRLITPYPVEADIDPGASVMDRDQADLGFLEIVDTWLREELSGDASGLLAELVLAGSRRDCRADPQHSQPSPPSSRHRPRCFGRIGTARNRIPGGGGGIQGIRSRLKCQRG